MYQATFRVNANPRPQPRKRSRQAGTFIQHYTPKEDPIHAWREAVVLAARPFRPPAPLDCPVRVDCVWFLKRPANRYRKKDPEGPYVCPSKRPGDRDNLDKAVLDCLADDGWFVDDGRICGGELWKLYHGKAGAPGMIVHVRELPETFRPDWITE